MAEAADDLIFHESLDILNAITLKKGVKVTIYAGANALTFRVRLMGVMNDAKTDVYADGSKVATLTQYNSNVIVNAKTIDLVNQRQRDQSADYFPV